jgi:anti-sigma regulatory factor (Ser/Thr protein kinase)
MMLSFSFNVENTDDLQNFLVLIKEQGFDKFIKKTAPKKTTASPKRAWKHIGIGHLDGALDNVNIRDLAYED